MKKEDLNKAPCNSVVNSSFKTDSQCRAGEYLANFNRALEDDLSTPRALAELWGLLKDPSISPGDALAAAFDMDGVLGLDLAREAELRPENSEDPAFAAEIERLIKERQEAKGAKNYQKADEIRLQLKEKGIILEDSSTGTTWKRL